MSDDYRIALRPYATDGGDGAGPTDLPLDDIVVKNVAMFHMEDMGDHFWMCCYLDNGPDYDRISFTVRTGRRSKGEPRIVVEVYEFPESSDVVLRRRRTRRGDDVSGQRFGTEYGQPHIANDLPRSATTYVHYGCRCDDCREANRLRYQKWREAHRTRNGHPTGKPFSASTYVNYGCRCDGCRAAHSDKLRHSGARERWRDRQAAKRDTP